MDSLKQIPQIALMLVISAIVIGAGAISLTEFGNTTEKCWNSSYEYQMNLNVCNGTAVATVHAAESPGSNFSYAFYSIDSGQSANGSVANQLTTVGIIAIMVIIISLIVGVLAYFQFFRR